MIKRITSISNLFIRMIRGMIILRSFKTNRLQVGKRVKLRGVKNIVFGENVVIEDDAWVEAILQYQNVKFNPSLVIGNNVVIGKRNIITCIEKIYIGNNCLFAPSVLITDHYHGNKNSWNTSEIKSKSDLTSFGGIIIEENVWIGYNSAILKNAKIPKNAVIPALTKVTH